MINKIKKLRHDAEKLYEELENVEISEEETDEIKKLVDAVNKINKLTRKDYDITEYFFSNQERTRVNS